MNKEEYWKIIDELNWKGRCENNEHRPYEKIGKLISEKYPYQILELCENTREEKYHLTTLLRKNNIPCGNDSGWDLTAHIIGCGKPYLDETMNKICIGEYTNENIYQLIDYRENFQYSFNKAFGFFLKSKGIETNGLSEEEVYKSCIKKMVREENINIIIN